MINLSDISGLYKLLPESAKAEIVKYVFEQPYKSGILFHKTVEQIRTKLKINLPYYSILTSNCLELLHSDEYNLVKIPDDDFCLKPLKRSVEKSEKPVILNLDLLPVFYPTNLQNISPAHIILRISGDLFLIFSKKTLKTDINDPFITVALKTYALLLTDERFKGQPSYTQELISILAPYNITCTEKRAFYGLCIDTGSTQSAEKFYNYLLINDILTRKKGRKICFYLYPLTAGQTNHLLGTVRAALKKLQTRQ